MEPKNIEQKINCKQIGFHDSIVEFFFFFFLYSFRIMSAAFLE